MDSIFIPDDAYEQLASETEELIDQLENLPYPKVKEDVGLLLQNIDLLHREALSRLFKEIIINHSELRHKMQDDKAVKLLFSLYDLFHTDIQTSILAQEELHSGYESKYPLWIPVGYIHELKENTAYKYVEEGENLLICKTEGEVYVVRNCCGHTVLPLDGATIDKGFLICPWHGCDYRLSDGVMVSNPVHKLKKYQVTIQETGQIRIGLNM